MTIRELAEWAEKNGAMDAELWMPHTQKVQSVRHEIEHWEGVKFDVVTLSPFEAKSANNN